MGGSRPPDVPGWVEIRVSLLGLGALPVWLQTQHPPDSHCRPGPGGRKQSGSRRLSTCYSQCRLPENCPPCARKTTHLRVCVHVCVCVYVCACACVCACVCVERDLAAAGNALLLGLLLLRPRHCSRHALLLLPLQEALRRLKDHWVSVREHHQQQQGLKAERYRQRLELLLTNYSG